MYKIHFHFYPINGVFFIEKKIPKVALNFMQFEDTVKCLKRHILFIFSLFIAEKLIVLLKMYFP